jgi:hypothetical protein
MPSYRSDMVECREKHINNAIFRYFVEDQVERQDNGPILVLDNKLNTTKCLLKIEEIAESNIHIVECVKDAYEEMCKMKKKGLLKINIHNMKTTKFLSNYSGQPFSAMYLDYCCTFKNKGVEPDIRSLFEKNIVRAGTIIMFTFSRGRVKYEEGSLYKAVKKFIKDSGFPMEEIRGPQGYQSKTDKSPGSPMITMYWKVTGEYVPPREGGASKKTGITKNRAIRKVATSVSRGGVSKKTSTGGKPRRSERLFNKKRNRLREMAENVMNKCGYTQARFGQLVGGMLQSQVSSFLAGKTSAKKYIPRIQEVVKTHQST